MAANSGRDFLVKIGGTAIAGAQEGGMSVDNSPIDITDNGDAGFRTLANFTGPRSMDLSMSGVWKDATVRDLAIGVTSPLLTDATLDFADGGAITGDFYLANYEETGTHDGAVTFTGTLQSSGAWAYVAAI